MSIVLENRMDLAGKPPEVNAYTIVFGNEKGGTGKTTTAVHVAISLLRLGMSVSAIDLDSRQRSFDRYIQNRSTFMKRTGVNLPLPNVRVIERSSRQNIDSAVAEESERLSDALDTSSDEADFIIIDMPGNDTNLSRLGHAVADCLVTPMNDSFLDFDLLAKIDPETLEILCPSLYSEFVWECRKRRLLSQRPAMDWVVTRNRVSSINAHNKHRVGAALNNLADRIGFRFGPGLAERVVYRELFPFGLTLLDLPASGVPVKFSMSHVSARQELRALMSALQLPGLEMSAPAG